MHTDGSNQDSTRKKKARHHIENEKQQHNRIINEDDTHTHKKRTGERRVFSIKNQMSHKASRRHSGQEAYIVSWV